MKRALLSVGCSVMVSFAASAQWVNKEAPLPQNNVIHDNLSVVDENTVWTTDLLRGLNSVNRTLNVYISRTADGGATWQTAALPDLMQSEYSITSLQGIDANTAWVSISTYSANEGGRILKTTDGGKTWSTQIEIAGFIPRWVRFLNATTGLIICKSAIFQVDFIVYVTQDGGTTWTKVPAGVLPAQQVENPFAVSYGIRPAVAHSGSTLWFGTSMGRVFRTTDSGQTWTVANTNSGEIRHLQFRNELNGLAMSVSDQLSRTTDGGVTWTRVAHSGPLHSVGLANIPGTQTYISTGYTGTLNGPGSSISSDDGQTWTILESTMEHAFVDFASPTVGWSSSIGRVGTNSLENGGMNRFTTTILSNRDGKGRSPAVVYPNPSVNGRFTVNPAERIQHLQVVDVAGRVILNVPKPRLNVDGSLPIDLSQQSAGFYRLILQTMTGFMQEKLIVHQ